LHHQKEDQGEICWPMALHFSFDDD